LIRVFGRLLEAVGVARRPALRGQRSERHPTRDELKPGKLVVVYGGAKDKWACFQCPGGCGEKIQLSLAQERRPRWQVNLDMFGRPTITPSVHMLNACRCHFWVRGGEIEWCQDSGHSAARAPAKKRVSTAV
jgi:hypothetical protein